MKRSDPGVLDRLARIAAGWTPPARQLSSEPVSAGRSSVNRDAVHPGKRPATVGLILVLATATVVTVVWMVLTRARPVVVVPELTSDPVTARADRNQGEPSASEAASPVISAGRGDETVSATGVPVDSALPPTSRPMSNNPAYPTLAASASRITTEGAAAAVLLVHVAGPVRSPGVVILPIGSRVVDAIDAAGGLRKGAKIGQTNLAAVLSDGQRVEVGASNPQQVGSGAVAGSADIPTRATPSSPLNLNTATAQQLDSLPGVGPVTAAKILAWRAANGRFNTVDELGEVAGIGPVKLAELRAHVTV